MISIRQTSSTPCYRRRLESRCRLFMVVHVAANIPELLSSRSLPVHHQYRNQSVNQHRSCRDGHTGLHLFQEKTPQQRHRGDARDHGRYYPIYPYPPGSHTTTGLHSRLPSSSGKLYTSHRGRENHYRQSQHLRTPKMRDLRIHHVLGWHVGHAFLDPDRPRGTLFCQRTHGRSLFNALPAETHRDFPPDDDYCRLRDRFPTHLTLYIPVLRHPANGNCRNLHDLPGLPAHANLRSGGMDCSLLHRLASRLGHERLHLGLHHHPRFPTHLDHASKTSGRKSLETIHDGLNN